MAIEYVNDEVPEELTESTGFVFPGEVVELGFVKTPAFKIASAERGNYKVQPRMFVYGIEPLSYEIDRNPESWQYEQQENLRRGWYNHLDKNGSPISAKSPFGVVKAAFKGLGYEIRNLSDCEAIVGHKFKFRATPIKFAGEDSKEITVDVPIEELSANYKWEGVKTVRRYFYDDAPAVSEQQESVDADKLKTVLNGKSQSEFIMALAGAGLNAYIDEAANGEALIKRMQRLGMQVVDGKLVTT